MYILQVIIMEIVTAIILTASTLAISSFKLKFFTKKDLIFIYIFCPFSLFMTYYFSYIYIILIILMYIYILKNEHYKFQKYLFPILSILMFYLTDQIFILLTNIINLTIQASLLRIYVYIMLSFLELITMVALLYLIKILLIKLNVISDNNIESPKGFYIIFGITYSLLIGINIFLKNERILIIILILTIGFIFSFLFYYNYLVQIMDNTIKAQQLEEMHHYTAELEDYCKNFRKLDHYYNNILFTLAIYIENGNIEELTKYYKEKVLPSFDKFNYEYTNLMDLKKLQITELQSLLTVKVMIAQNQHIKVNIEINYLINHINLHVLDLCKIVGILFDNAVEASLMHSSPEINVYLTHFENRIELKIANTYSNDSLDVSKIMDTNYSTNGKNRGLGLNIVRGILKENENLDYNIYAKNNIFIFTIDILNI